YADGVSVDREGNALGKGNRLFSNSRHSFPLVHHRGVSLPRLPLWASGLCYPRRLVCWVKILRSAQGNAGWALTPIQAALVNFAENFAANAFLARLASCHHALRRSQDVDTESAENAWDLVVADIYAAARTRNSVDRIDRSLVVVTVLQVDTDDFLSVFFHRLEIADVAFFLQDAGKFELQLGSWNVHLLVTGLNRIANPCQEICYGIGQTHRFLLLNRRPFSFIAAGWQPAIGSALLLVSP